MKIQSFTLLITLFFLNLIALAQRENRSNKNDFRKADSLIDIGKSGQASLLLNKIIKQGCNDYDEYKAEILSARILHEYGARVEALEKLQTLLAAPFIHMPQNIDLRVEAYLGLADCYYGMFWIEKFKNVSDTVLQLSSKYQIPEWYKARSYNNIARYYNFHTLGEARYFLDSANALFKNAPATKKKYYHPIALLNTTLNFSRNFDNGIPFKYADSAFQLLNQGCQGEKFNQIQLWRTIGNAYMDWVREPMNYSQPAYQKAILAFNSASAMLEKFFPSNKIDLVTLKNLQGLLYFNTGEYKLSQQYFDCSKKILFDHHISLENFSYTYLNTYLWELGNIDSLYKGEQLFIERKKELTHWQQLAPYWTKWEENNQKTALHYYRNIYAANPYNNIVQLCYELYQHDKNNRYLDTAFAAQESNKCYFLKQKMMKEYNLNNPEAITIQTIQQKLVSNQAVISFSDGVRYLYSSYAIIITSDTVSIIKIAMAEISKLVGSLKNSDSVCRDLNTFKTKSHVAYNIVFKPIRQMLPKNIDHILVLPSTNSSFFDFGMLITDTIGIRSYANLPYLGKRYHFNYEFSWQVATLRNQIVHRRQNSSNTLQAYVPDYTNTPFYRLPFFTQSTGSLKNRFGFTAFNKKGATLSTYGANAGNASILHLAGHCFSDEVIAENLEIAMDSSKAGETYYLNAEKIINTPLTADLTVLSLCETGIGEYLVADSYLNMAYWFSYAGSKSCLYSYWKLDDRSTAYILERFYHHLALGMKKSEALSHAKNDYLEQAKTDEEKNPVYWGGLTLIGDNSPIEIEEQKYSPHRYWALLIIFPGILYFYKRRKNSVAG